ncbi:hypothetical protein [Leifsonia tongyongensis]|uniref:hypothetical protein n=1 Tax=Leifsonia tongyongensis TaxID=1268043 RepID=UPI001F047045
MIKKLEDAGLVHRNHSVFVSRQSNTELVTRIDALLKWAHQNKISFDTVMHAVRGRTRPEESRLLETPTAGQPSQPAGESASESDTARERFTHAEAKKQQLETNPHAQTENRAAMIEEPSFTQGTDRPLAERASSQTDNAPSNVGEPVVSSEPVPVVVDPPLRIGDGSARVDGDALPVVDVAAGVDASERSPRAVNGVSVTGETPKYEGGVRQASAESQWVDNSEPEEWEADLLRQEPWRN